MSDKKVRVPQIRFAGFMGEWEERKLGSLVTAITRTDSESTAPVMMISAASGFINQSEKYSSNNAGQSLAKYILLRKGELAYNHGASKQRQYGSCFDLKVDEARIPFVYHCFEVGQNNPDFIARELNEPRMDKQLRRLVSSGARMDGLLNISFEAYKTVIITVPQIKEQDKISGLLLELDNLITLQQRQLDKLDSVKKNMLEKMFPKDGANVPEIRFSGFKGAWEQRKLSAMTDYKNGKGHEDRQSDNGKYELINLNSISIDGGLKHSGKFVDETEDTLVENDLVMVLSDVGHGDLLGRVALIPENDRFVLNQRVALLRPNNTVDPQFLFSHINAHQQYFKTQGAGMSQLNISKGSVEGFTSWVPHKEEQIKIGELFSNLDNLITLHQRELNALKTLKKSMLQQLFV